MFSPLLLAMTCDDDPSDDKPAGTWSLISVSGGITGTEYNFEPGLITWKFNYDSTVNVVNNNAEDSDAEDFFETGTYNYQYLPNELSGCENVIYIDSINFGCQDLRNPSYTLTQTTSDGYTLKFQK